MFLNNLAHGLVYPSAASDPASDTWPREERPELSTTTTTQHPHQLPIGIINQVPISSMFYEQLLHTHIQKV